MHKALRELEKTLPAEDQEELKDRRVAMESDFISKTQLKRFDPKFRSEYEEFFRKLRWDYRPLIAATVLTNVGGIGSNLHMKQAERLLKRIEKKPMDVTPLGEWEKDMVKEAISDVKSWLERLRTGRLGGGSSRITRRASERGASAPYQESRNDGGFLFSLSRGKGLLAYSSTRLLAASIALFT